MKLIYDGIHDAVEIPEAGGIVAERGKAVEIPDEIAERLLERDDWDKPKTRGSDR